LRDYHQQPQCVDLEEEGKKELNEGGRGGKHTSMITKGTSVGVGITSLVNTWTIMQDSIQLSIYSFNMCLNWIYTQTLVHRHFPCYLSLLSCDLFSLFLCCFQQINCHELYI
jgi:hypothetical protein